MNFLYMKFLGGGKSKAQRAWKSFMEVLNFHGGDELFPCAPFCVSGTTQNSSFVKAEGAPCEEVVSGVERK